MKLTVANKYLKIIASNEALAYLLLTDEEKKETLFFYSTSNSKSSL
jgi:hypothetical protein